MFQILIPLRDPILYFSAKKEFGFDIEMQDRIVKKVEIINFFDFNFTLEGLRKGCTFYV